MTVFELDRQATPGALTVSGIDDKRVSTDAVLVSFVGPHRNPRYVARVYGQGALTNLCEERDANAILLAHCRNNFLRALEALKTCAHEVHREAMTRANGELGERYLRELDADMVKLIKELETI